MSDQRPIAEYRFSIAGAIWSAFFGFLFFAGIFILALVIGAPIWITFVIFVISFVVSVYNYINKRSKLFSLYRDRVVQVNFYHSRTLMLHDIRGRRLIDDGVLLLISHSGQSHMSLPKIVTKDPVGAEWVVKIPDLDRQELDQELKALRRDPYFGNNSDARDQAIQRLGRLATILYIVGAVSTIWVLIPIFYPYAIAVGLAAPVVALILKMAWPRMFTFLPGWLPVPVPLLSFLFVGVALAFRGVNDVSLIDWTPPLFVAVALSVSLTILVMNIEERRLGPIAALFIGSLFLGWAWGGAIMLNAWEDKAVSIRLVQVEWVGSSRLGGTDRNGQAINDVVLAPGVLRAAQQGDPVCLIDMAGRLGWRHQRVAPCRIADRSD